MIRTDEQLARTQEALRHVEAALAALLDRRPDIHPDRFTLMAEPLESEIARLRAEVEAYHTGPPAGAKAAG